MLSISEQVASYLYHIASVVLIFAGIVAYWAGKRMAEFGDRHMAELKATVAVAALEIEDRKKENLQLSLQLENAKSSHDELAKALAPRTIEQGQSSQALKIFKGIEVVILPIQDRECQEVAAQINCLVELAGWKLIDIPPSGMEIAIRGIVLQGSHETKDAVKELRRQLVSKSHVTATVMPDIDNLPPNTIKIVVGPNKPLYFDEKRMRELTKDSSPEQREQVEWSIEVMRALEELDIDNFNEWFMERQRERAEAKENP